MNYKLAVSTILSMGLVNTVYALPYSESVSGEMMLQGGTQSQVSWAAPTPGKNEVYVSIPKGSTAKSASYRIYPKGTNDAGVCSSTDPVAPCFEAIVNQNSNKGKLVQLSVKRVKSWDFSTNGFVTVAANKTAPAEMVGVAGARFNQVARTLQYSKISNTGKLLDDAVTLGSNSDDWGCTRDDNTGLVWEIKTADKGLRDKDNQYSWYNPDPSANGGGAGLEDGAKGLCTGNINCDSNAYVKAVNAQTLCGFSDWRVPSYRELASIIKAGTFPAIDVNYFPNSTDADNDAFRTWSSTTDSAYPDKAWYLYFGNGTASLVKSSGATMRLRLVRGGL